MTDTPASSRREGSLEAPTRHPIDWRSSEFGDPTALDAELGRVFDICHGCRRCFSLCNSFPTLFDAVDDRFHLPFVGGRREYETVGDDQLLADVEDCQVARELVSRSGRRCFSELDVAR